MKENICIYCKRDIATGFICKNCKSKFSKKLVTGAGFLASLGLFFIKKSFNSHNSNDSQYKS